MVDVIDGWMYLYVERSLYILYCSRTCVFQCCDYANSIGRLYLEQRRMATEINLTLWLDHDFCFCVADIANMWQLQQ